MSYWQTVMAVVMGNALTMIIYHLFIKEEDWDDPDAIA